MIRVRDHIIVKMVVSGGSSGIDGELTFPDYFLDSRIESIWLLSQLDNLLEHLPGGPCVGELSAYRVHSYSMLRNCS